MLRGSQGREEEKRRAGYAETWRADKKYHP